MTENISSFSISIIPRAIFGAGSCSDLGKIAAEFGKRILLVTGGNSYTQTRTKGIIEKALPLNKFEYFRYAINGEPSPSTIDEAVSSFKTKKPGLVIAVGGGSVLDAGKAIAAMLAMEGSVKDYLEDAGTLKPTGKRLPLIAIPTTSGTGSEATKNAVITEFGKHGFKKSLRHNRYVPDIAIIDPELMLDCPPAITAASGMDAFSQLLESYLSKSASPFTDALALSGLERIARSFQEVVINGNNIDARADIAYASHISGITLTNAGLGVIHGLAQPLGSLFRIPHGIVCGTLMSPVNKVTVEFLRKSDPGNTLHKYAKAGSIFSNDQKKGRDFYVNHLLNTIERYTLEFNIPRLGKYGVTHENINIIASKTGMKNHPVTLDESYLRRILLSRI